ncbi:urease accessory protein UreD [Streptomyces sp. NPDC087437]|uniref:urease accessory protein UreD n=1 Tax=Streptomyces sp. NPDC087437 TaxID=3365789 RepID=UPI00382F268C
MPRRSRPVMRAHARLEVTADRDRSGRVRTRISRLRSDAPLVLRPTAAVEPSGRWNPHGAAHVALAAAAAGPIGGDHLRLDVEVAAGAALVVRSVAATLVLPGPHGRPSRTETHLRVAPAGTLVWLPEPVIAAGRCDHHATTRIDLEPGARLLAREELLLGRHNETPGTVHQRLRVTLAGRPLHDQEFAVGPDVPGWHGPAVTGGHRALGTLLVIAPDSPPDTRPNSSPTLTPTPTDADADTAVMRLTPTATLLTVLADDALTLRRHLDRGMTGPPDDCAIQRGSGPPEPAETLTSKGRVTSGN